MVLTPFSYSRKPGLVLLHIKVLLVVWCCMKPHPLHSYYLGKSMEFVEVPIRQLEHTKHKLSPQQLGNFEVPSAHPLPEIALVSDEITKPQTGITASCSVMNMSPTLGSRCQILAYTQCESLYTMESLYTLCAQPRCTGVCTVLCKLVVHVQVEMALINISGSN